MWHVWSKLLWWGDLKDGDHLEDLGTYKRIILKWRALVDVIMRLRVR